MSTPTPAVGSDHEMFPVGSVIRKIQRPWQALDLQREGCSISPWRKSHSAPSTEGVCSPESPCEQLGTFGAHREVSGLSTCGGRSVYAGSGGPNRGLPWNSP